MGNDRDDRLRSARRSKIDGSDVLILKSRTGTLACPTNQTSIYARRKRPINRASESGGAAPRRGGDASDEHIQHAADEKSAGRVERYCCKNFCAKLSRSA